MRIFGLQRDRGARGFRAGLIVLGLGLIGCASATPEIKAKIEIECAVHDGYVHMIQEGVPGKDGKKRQVTKDDLVKMVLLSRKGWYALKHYTHDTPAPDEKFNDLSTALVNSATGVK